MWLTPVLSILFMQEWLSIFTLSLHLRRALKLCAFFILIHLTYPRIKKTNFMSFTPVLSNLSMQECSNIFTLSPYLRLSLKLRAFLNSFFSSLVHLTYPSIKSNARVAHSRAVQMISARVEKYRHSFTLFTPSSATVRFSNLTPVLFVSLMQELNRTFTLSSVS